MYSTYLEQGEQQQRRRPRTEVNDGYRLVFLFGSDGA